MNKALYRKYRPKTFDEIAGQSAIVQTLKNQIKSNRIGHAYLFYGLRGSGKTSIARILAKAVNCSNPVDGNPCLQCEHCNYQNDVNPDIIEIDAASNNGVDSTRQLIDEVNYKPTNTKYKVYIIDEVHMLSNSAFNALLKTLEEPPEHVIFILATTELNKVPGTIKSRCQVYTFKQININDIKNYLNKILKQENINYYDDNCLEYIAKKSDGSMRDAISILDQCIMNHVDVNNKATLQEMKELFGDVEDEVINDLIQCIENSDVLKGLDILHDQYYKGVDLKSLLQSLYQYYFNSFANSFGTTEGTIFERYARILGETISSMDKASQKMVTVEVTFIKMCKPEMESDYNSVVHRMNNLEKELTLLKSGNIPKIVDNIDKEFDSNAIVYYNNHCNHIFTIVGG